ncbi:HNH endonuclease [Lachnospiraceae bacterium]|nr:HNH endonuclease [Lachnospiraceae bacterium]
MDAIEVFKNEYMQYCLDHESEAKHLRAEFINDYPLESISNLSMDQFLTGQDGVKTFCSRIRYDMKVLASMGNAYPSTFGIYYKKEEGVKLSSTYEKIFGNNTDRAFESIKKEIIKVLESARRDDYSFFESRTLSSTFICKLIIIYYPQKVFPVCTKPALENYCRVLGMSYDSDDNMLEMMRALLEWKKNLGEISEWSDYIYMRFGDWLWKSGRTIKDCNIKKYSMEEAINEADSINEIVNSIGLVGSDKEAVVKQRINQSLFREKLLSRYSKCCLCGVSDQRFLIASHIKPWSLASPEERVDIDNGFLFCPNHDKAFDKGFISFDDEGNIIISDKIDSVNRVFLNVREDMRLKLTEGNRKYLKFHRSGIFNNPEE